MSYFGLKTDITSLIEAGWANELEDNLVGLNAVYNEVIPADTDSVTVLNAAITALPVAGGCIMIKAPNNFDGDITIPKSGVTLTTEKIAANNDNTYKVRISRLIIDSTTIPLNKIRLRGIQFQETSHQVGAGGVINYVYYDDCNFRSGTSPYNHSVKFTGTVNYYQNIFFNRCSFWDYGGWHTNPACISFEHTGTGGNGQIYFNDCSYMAMDATNDNCVWMAFQDAAQLDSLYIHNLSPILIGTNVATTKAFKFHTGAQVMCARWRGGLYEAKDTGTIVDIDDGTAICAQLSIENVDFTVDNAKTTSLCVNAAHAADFDVTKLSHVRFVNCFKRGTVGTLSAGTPVPNASFYFTIEGFRGGVLSENTGTSTGTGGEQTLAHGLMYAPQEVIIIPTEVGMVEHMINFGGGVPATNIYPTCTAKTYKWIAKVGTVKA